jgi:sec-independent protein translocase protein TatB
MLDLSPVKILVVLVVALIVLGPDKLPQLARQLGAAWGDLRRFRARLESDVRGAFPDLPPTHEVAQAVRSPLAFLDRLADEHEKSLGASTEPGVSPPSTESPPSTGSPSSALTSNGNGAHPVAGARATGEGAGADPETWGPLAGVPDDPNMN